MLSYRSSAPVLALLCAAILALLSTTPALAVEECGTVAGGVLCNIATGGSYGALTCEQAARGGLLHANITNGTASLYNDANHTYNVTLVIYNMYAAAIEDETVFSTARAMVGPKGNVTLTAAVPACAYQVDFICGDALEQPPFYGERMIASIFGNQEEYCTQQPTNDPSANVTVRIAPFYPQNSSYVFLCDAQGFTPTGYNWYFGDDNILFHHDRNDVYHTYAAAGNYTVACRATSGNRSVVGTLNVSVNQTGPFCGNGIIDAGEQCDTTAPAGLNCTADCKLTQACSLNTSTISSDATTIIVETGQPAVIAWEPPQDIDPSMWDQQISYAFANADWIWSTYRSEQPENGSIRTFRKTFNITGAPLNGALRITAADAYDLFVNGQPVGAAQVDGDWKNSNLTQAFVHTEGWQSVESYDVTSRLVAGQNSIVIVAANEYMGPLDQQPAGTPETNPAGIIFELAIQEAIACTGNQTGNVTIPNTTNVTNQTNGTTNQTNGTPINQTPINQTPINQTPNNWTNTSTNVTNQTGNQTDNQTGGNQTGNQTGGNQTGNQTGGGNMSTCPVQGISFTSVTNPVDPNGYVTIRGSVTTNGADVSGRTITINGFPVSILMNQFLLALQAPSAEGTFDITAQYSDSSCAPVLATTAVTVGDIIDGGGGGGGGGGGSSFSSGGGGFYCFRGWHKEGDRCVRDEPPEPTEQTDDDEVPLERDETDEEPITEPEVDEEPEPEVPVTSRPNATGNQLTGAVTGNPLASWWPLILLGIILLGLGGWYWWSASKADAAAQAKTTRRRKR